MTEVTGYRAPMDTRLIVGTAVLATAVAGVALAPVSAAPDPAPSGAKSTWTEADKAGFGTSRSRGSNVWFTLQGGRVSEVFYPDLSTPSVRTLELAVVATTLSTVRRRPLPPSPVPTRAASGSVSPATSTRTGTD